MKTSDVCLYQGLSMYPTLREPDVLEVRPYGAKRPQCGDVILFELPGETHLIVHRISAISPQGIRTRGDNNPVEDSFLLKPEHIRGKVSAVWRGQRQRPLAGGRAGRISVIFIRYRQRVIQHIVSCCRPYYHRFSQKGVLGRFLPSSVTPFVIQCSAYKNHSLRLVLGKWVIGRYDTQRKCWAIRWPFRLFVDERRLP